MPEVDPRKMGEDERWLVEELDRLRGRRFSAPGLVDFLTASLARARRARARRPELVAQSRRFGAVGLAAALGRGRAHAIWWLGWWAMVDWHLGMAETEDGRGRPLGAADALTLARLWTAPLVRRRPDARVIAAASASDLLDGMLARRAGPTRLGRDLDSAADATFLHAALGGLVEAGRLRPWVLAAERARLVSAAAVGVASYFGRSARPPTPRERASAAVLGAAGLLVAAARPGPPRGPAGTARARVGGALVGAAIATRAGEGLGTLARAGRWRPADPHRGRCPRRLRHRLWRARR